MLRNKQKGPYRRADYSTWPNIGNLFQQRSPGISLKRQRKHPPVDVPQIPSRDSSVDSREENLPEGLSDRKTSAVILPNLFSPSPRGPTSLAETTTNEQQALRRVFTRVPKRPGLDLSASRANETHLEARRRKNNETNVTSTTPIPERIAPRNKEDKESERERERNK